MEIPTHISLTSPVPFKGLGRKELAALLSLSSWCLMIVVWLFLVVPWVYLQFFDCGISDRPHYYFWFKLYFIV